MTLNNRQIDLINILDSLTYRKGSILAQKLKVSTRTIRNDIAHINSIYPSKFIESHKQKGYKLNPNIHTLNQKYNVFTPNERLIYITFNLLKYNQINLLITQQTLFISDRTLDLDLIRLKKYINSYSTSIELHRSKDIVTLSNTNNHQLLHYLSSILFDDFPHGLISSFFESLDYTVLYQIISENLYKHNLHPKYFSISMLSIECAFILEKYKHNSNSIAQSSHSKSINLFILDILNDIQINFDIEVVHELERFMYPYLRINELENLPIDYDQLNGIRLDLNNDINEINKIYSIQIHLDDPQLETLSKHIYFSIFRAELGIIRENCLSKYLESEYLFIIDLAITELNWLNSRLKYPLHTTELMYLCAYFALLYHNSRTQAYVNVDIYVPESRANASLIMFKLKEQFNHPLLQYNLYHTNKNTDLLISTESIDFNIPTFKLKKNPELIDYTNIASQIKTYVSKIIVKRLLSRINVIFLGEFLLNESFNSYQDILLKHSDYLYQNGIVDYEFGKELMYRESVASTILDTGISIPHSIHRNQKRTSLSILKFKHPFEWDDTKIKRIIFLTFNPEDYDDIDDLLIHSLINISKNKALISKLNKFDSFIEGLKQLLIDIIFPI